MFAFQARVGSLVWDDFVAGEVVIRELPLEGRNVGPSQDCDWTRPFWAAGITGCRHCLRDIHGRVEIRDRRFSGVVVVDKPLGMLDWGYLDLEENKTQADESDD